MPPIHRTGRSRPHARICSTQAGHEAGRRTLRPHPRGGGLGRRHVARRGVHAGCQQLERAHPPGARTGRGPGRRHGQPGDRGARLPALRRRALPRPLQGRRRALRRGARRGAPPHRRQPPAAAAPRPDRRAGAPVAGAGRRAGDRADARAGDPRSGPPDRDLGAGQDRDGRPARQGRGDRRGRAGPAGRAGRGGRGGRFGRARRRPGGGFWSWSARPSSASSC